MAKQVTFCNSSINIWNHYLLVIIPIINRTFQLNILIFYFKFALISTLVNELLDVLKLLNTWTICLFVVNLRKFILPYLLHVLFQLPLVVIYLVFYGFLAIKIKHTSFFVGTIDTLRIFLQVSLARWMGIIKVFFLFIILVDPVQFLLLSLLVSQLLVLDIVRCMVVQTYRCFVPG